MKNTFLLLLLLTCGFVYGQDTVKRSNELNAQISEQYSVLKSNKKLKQGEYCAIYKGSAMLAKGRYDAGKRVGLWIFFTQKGRQIQTFDYDKYQFTYRDTTWDHKTYQYNLPQPIAPTDTVSNPVVIGGYDYTILPLVFQRKGLDYAVRSDFPPDQKINVKHVFTISAEGTLLKHGAIATANGVTKVYILDDKDLDDGSKKFIPGMINHQPVQCQIITSTPMMYTTTSGVSSSVTTRSTNRSGFGY